MLQVQTLFLLALLSTSWAAAGWLDLYEHDQTNGANKRFYGPTDWLADWNDRASSVRAEGNWELYSDWNFQGYRMPLIGGRLYNNLGGFNDVASSARPTCVYTGDANDAQLDVWEHGSQGGDKNSYTKDEFNLNGWNDRITSACAVRGDWELYEHDYFQGVRWVIKENECHNVPHNDYYTSLRPVCASYHPKCTVKKIRVGSQGLLSPIYLGTEVIGANSGGSCSGPSTANLGLTHLRQVTESTTLEFAESNENNWGVAVTVEVEAAAKVFGAGSSVTMGVSVSRGGSHTVSKSESTTKEVAHQSSATSTVNYPIPGAAIMFGVADKYKMDGADVPATMELLCPDGSTIEKETHIKVKSTTYMSAHFWSRQGKFHTQPCRNDWRLPQCVHRVQQQYKAFLGNANSQNIVNGFDACFAHGKGSINGSKEKK